MLLRMAHLPRTESRMTISEQKAVARKRFKAYRSSLTAPEYERYSNQICDRLERLRAWTAGEIVHVFWPIIERREPDIRPFIRRLFEMDVGLVMPIVVSFSVDRADGARLRHAKVDSLDYFKLNKWGIAEPKSQIFVSVNELDVVIVPALGADRNGHRIGYGMGYYDEFLSNVDIPIICPIFSGCLVDEIAHEGHDVAVSMIVTERATVDINVT